MGDPKTLTLDDFASLEGDPVTVGWEGGELEARLIEVLPLGSGLRRGGGFSLLFHGPPEPRLTQATYRVEHRTVGAHDMFLVPVARTAAGIQYEAVFT
ncbi:hypothetical protein EKE94_15035 [Mesobaculum littorinae]|uniref:DUF6916 domain-containing protein n=1 Tax=Mesobaculum littorinae TaxID=2486419 RepID=A0A438AE44_9RHOB|nr:hypothetical protein [Mesobaculum littorinae]RVV96983.1 hypothetical protein EKE94_15035 [Mesobaculum littorinae]